MARLKAEIALHNILTLQNSTRSHQTSISRVLRHRGGDTRAKSNRTSQ